MANCRKTAIILQNLVWWYLWIGGAMERSNAWILLLYAKKLKCILNIGVKLWYKTIIQNFTEIMFLYRNSTVTWQFTNYEYIVLHFYKILKKLPYFPAWMLWF